MEEFVQAEQELSFLSLQAEEINKGNEARREDDGTTLSIKISKLTSCKLINR